MKLTMLGTGDALATECYNTCFLFDDEGKYFMVDGGGGKTVLVGRMMDKTNRLTPAVVSGGLELVRRERHGCLTAAFERYRASKSFFTSASR